MSTQLHPTLDEIREAARRIAPHIHRTPVLTSRSIDGMAGCDIFFKCENFQKVGAFKARGAANALFSLTQEEAQRGVATHSSGNHAAALARAAGLRGTTAWIVMPRTAPAIKQAAVAGYGGKIVLCEPTLRAREEKLAEVVEETGAIVVHPYNDERVIAGQGTAALELLTDVPGLDVVMTPVGGGGLLSGTAIAAKGLEREIRIVAGEPAGADDAFRSLREGRILPSIDPRTIADGLLTSLGDKTFPIIAELVERIITVSDAQIVAAMRTLWERMKILIEPSSAVPLAALLAQKEEFRGQRVGLIVSGGNVDLDHLPWSTA